MIVARLKMKCSLNQLLYFGVMMLVTSFTMSSDLVATACVGEASTQTSHQCKKAKTLSNSSNDDKQAQKNKAATEAFQATSRGLLESEYIVSNSKVVFAGKVTAAVSDQLSLLNRLLPDINSAILIENGSKVLVEEKNSNLVIYFKKDVIGDLRGADYDALVTVNKKSSKILEILAGS